MPEHIFKPFIGCDIDTTRADYIAITTVDPRFLKEERALKQTCWFDYYDLHPVVATYLYAACFTEAYRTLMARREDVERAKYMQGFKGKGDIFETASRELMGFWKGRQNADRYGIPYDFYLRTVMLHADMNLWRRLPRPTQCYNKDITAIVREQWDMQTRARIRLPEHPTYRLENYTGAPHQERFHKWLIDRINHKPSPEFALGQYGYIDPVLPTEVIAQAFDDSLVRRASVLAA